MKDANTRKFVLVNRAFEAMLKVPRSEVLGKTVFEIYRAKDAERIDASDNEALANELGAYSPDYEIEMPHGDTRILATNRIVASDSQGVARHLIVVMDDVTEKKTRAAYRIYGPPRCFDRPAKSPVDHGQNRGRDFATSQARRPVRRAVAGSRPVQARQ